MLAALHWVSQQTENPYFVWFSLAHKPSAQVRGIIVDTVQLAESAKTVPEVLL